MQDYNSFADKNNNFYDDKTEIFFKTPLTRGSDDDRGFSFALKKVGITYDVLQRKTPVSLHFDISLRI